MRSPCYRRNLPCAGLEGPAPEWKVLGTAGLRELWDISVRNGVFSQTQGMPPAHTRWFMWRYVSLHTDQPADGSFLPSFEIKSLN